jgi:hypothetical protein
VALSYPLTFVRQLTPTLKANGMFDTNYFRQYTLCHRTQYKAFLSLRRVAMAATSSTIKRFFKTAVTSVTGRPQGVHGPLRGRDFMLDDQTFGADSDGH